MKGINVSKRLQSMESQRNGNTKSTGTSISTSNQRNLQNFNQMANNLSISSYNLKSARVKSKEISSKKLGSIHHKSMNSSSRLWDSQVELRNRGIKLNELGCNQQIRKNNTPLKNFPIQNMARSSDRYAQEGN